MRGWGFCGDEGFCSLVGRGRFETCPYGFMDGVSAVMGVFCGLDGRGTFETCPYAEVIFMGWCSVVWLVGQVSNLPLRVRGLDPNAGFA